MIKNHSKAREREREKEGEGENERRKEKRKREIVCSSSPLLIISLKVSNCIIICKLVLHS